MEKILKSFFFCGDHSATAFTTTVWAYLLKVDHVYVFIVLYYVILSKFSDFRNTMKNPPNELMSFILNVFSFQSNDQKYTANPCEILNPLWSSVPSSILTVEGITKRRIKFFFSWTTVFPQESRRCCIMRTKRSSRRI